MKATGSKLSCLIALVIVLSASSLISRADVTLLAYYTFDNQSNLGADSSNNGNDMTVGGGAPLYTNSAASHGGVVLDGNSWYVLPNGLISQIAGDFSVSLWLKTTQVSGADTDQAYTDAGIVWADLPGLTSTSIPMALTGHKLSLFTGNPNSTLHSTSNIDTGSFIHLAITRTQSTGQRKIYVNGVLNSSDTGGTNALTAPTQLLLGMDALNSLGINGVLDDVQIMSGVLDPRQVTYLHGNPGNPVPPLAILTLPVAASIVGTNFQLSFTTALNYDHVVQSSTNIASGSWQTLTNIIGDGTVQGVVVPLNAAHFRFFRVGSQAVGRGGS